LPTNFLGKTLCPIPFAYYTVEHFSTLSRLPKFGRDSLFQNEGPLPFFLFFPSLQAPGLMFHLVFFVFPSPLDEVLI